VRIPRAALKNKNKNRGCTYEQQGTYYPSNFLQNDNLSCLFACPTQKSLICMPCVCESALLFVPFKLMPLFFE